MNNTLMALSAAAALTVAAVSIPAAEVAGRAGIMRRKTVAAGPGRQAPAAPKTVSRACARGVAACTLTPGLAGLRPVYQQVANQRGSADCHQVCRHSARHRPSDPARSSRYPCTAIYRFLPVSSSPMPCPFIDHSSEIWNFHRDKT